MVEWSGRGAACIICAKQNRWLEAEHGNSARFSPSFTLYSSTWQLETSMPRSLSSQPTSTPLTIFSTIECRASPKRPRPRITHIPALRYARHTHAPSHTPSLPPATYVPSSASVPWSLLGRMHRNFSPQPYAPFACISPEPATDIHRPQAKPSKPEKSLDRRMLMTYIICRPCHPPHAPQNRQVPQDMRRKMLPGSFHLSPGSINRIPSSSRSVSFVIYTSASFQTASVVSM